MALSNRLLLSAFGSVLLNFNEQSGIKVLVVIYAVGFVKFGEVSWLDSVHEELSAWDEVEFVVNEHNHFDILPVPENGGSLLVWNTYVGQSVSEVLVWTVISVVVNVAEVNVTVSDGNEEVVLVGNNSDGAFALKESGAQNWQVSVSSVQESSHNLFVLRLRNVLEVVSDQAVDSAVAWVKWVTGQVWDWDFVVNGRSVSSDAVHCVNQKLVVGLIEKNSGVSTGDDFTALGEPSGIVQGVKSFSEIDLVNVELFAVFIDDSKEFSVDVKFQNSGNHEISGNVEEVRVNSGVNSKVVKVEFACFNIVNDDQNKVWKDGSLGWNLLDDDVVLLSINENDGIGALENELESLEVLVENFDLDLVFLIEDGGFIVMIGVNCNKNSLFVL